MTSRTVKVVPRLAALSALAALLSLSVTASAVSVPDTRYVAPDGVGDCTEGSPCDLASAVAATGTNDTIVFAAGTYELTDTITLGATGISLQGADTEDKPVLVGATGKPVLDLSGSDVELLDLVVRGTTDPIDGVPYTYMVAMGPTASMHRVKLVNTGFASTLYAPESQLQNSVVWASHGVAAAMSGAITQSTVLADPAQESVAIVLDESRMGAGTFTLTIRNTIARAGYADVLVQAADPSVYTVDIDYSNYRGTVTREINAIAIEGTHNVTTAPDLVNMAGAADIHQQAGSSTIDAGDAALLGGGTQDFKGAPRANGTPDIGADEVAAPTVASVQVDEISGRGATLHAWVRTWGVASTVTFSHASTALPALHVPASDHNLVPLQRHISGLAPGTDTYYAAAASNTFGVTFTPPFGFTTLPLDGAEIRDVSPTGTGSDCTALAPCSLATAAATTGDGDTIRFAAGEYPLDDTLSITAADVVLEGSERAQKPLLHLTGTGAALALPGLNPTLRNLEIKGVTSTAPYFASLGNGARLEAVKLTNAGDSVTLLARDATIVDSVVQANSQGAAAISGSLFGSTVLCDPESAACNPLLLAEAHLGAGARDLLVRNSIALGPNGIVVDASNAVLSMFLLDIDYAALNEEGISTSGTRSGKTVGTHNVASASLRSQAPGGDVRQVEGSPTIGAGNSGDDLSGVDFDGDERNNPVDIGADETAGPVATLDAASNITSHGATFTGVVNPNGQATTYHLAYGPTFAKTLATANIVIPAGWDDQTIEIALTGLTPNTKYYYALKATNASGTLEAGSSSFTTLALTPPVVATTAASAIGSHGATLNGTVDPNGKSTTYHFEYGATDAYGQVTPDVTPADLSGTLPVSAAVIGLPASSTLHFRLVATNADGTTNGADMTFTTAADATPPPPPVDPPTVDPAPVLGTLTFPQKIRSGASAKLKFNLSERARVTIVINRLVTGYISGGRCKPVTTGTTPCNTIVARGTLTSTRDAASPVVVTFPGKVGGKVLAPGVYRITVYATDLVTGKTSRWRTRTLTVTK